MDEPELALYLFEGDDLVYASPRITELLGWAPQPWVGDADAFRQAISDLPGVKPQETRTIRGDGTPLALGVLLEPAPPGVRDPLTGLTARPGFEDHLRVALARAREEDRRVVVLHVDLDEFRLVNDSLGREAGDEVLRVTAGRLRAAVSSSAPVARLEGDEFAVLLADLDGNPESLAQTAAGTILAAVGDRLEVAGRSLQLGATLGASLFPHDAEDEDGLLRHAESAMRHAKENQRGGLGFYAGGTSEALERLMLTAGLSRALERDQFVLHYQPIFHMPGGEVAAVEALLRWEDPERGLIGPLTFIPTAEYTGLIEPIGRWVCEHAAAQAAAWRAEGIEVPVAVNVSLRQFRDPKFVSGLQAALARAGLAPEGLLVEITESTAMREPACVEPVLAQLRDLGIRVAIDDFGTGYSSLGRLGELEVDLIKVDRTLMPEGDGPGSELCAAALALVGALGRCAVAEGVETAAQRSFVEGRQVALAQGFHLALPLPAEEATALLRSHPCRPLGRG